MMSHKDFWTAEIPGTDCHCYGGQMTPPALVEAVCVGLASIPLMCLLPALLQDDLHCCGLCSQNVQDWIVRGSPNPKN